MSQKKKWLIAGVLVLGVGISLIFWLYREIRIDKCLDAGGAWDYAQQHCIFDAPQK